VVLLNYGSGSVKRNGIYDQVIAIMKEDITEILKESM
jgi:alcohol dehydrogenase YqhD (iron-dependent ADH family)